MIDSKILSACIDSRAAWERLEPHLQSDEFPAMTKFWWGQIGDWYRRDPQARSIDRSLLVERGKLGIKNEKHVEALVSVITDLPESVSADNVASIALELKRFNVGNQLAAAIAGRESSKIGKLMREYQSLLEATDLVSHKTQWSDAVNVEDLFAKVGSENRIPLLPTRLNARLNGGALPGHHIIIFGRPEVGKSLVAINTAYGFVKQQMRTLYIGNEDEINIIKARGVTRVVGKPWAWCEANPEETTRLYRERGGEDYWRFIQLKHGTVEAIDKLVAEYRPQVVVVDQIRNLEASGTDGKMHSKLETISRDMRNLLLDYGLIGVSVTQARSREVGPGKEQPIYLGMEDIDSSHTGLPGTGDLIIGVAATQDMLMRGLRQLSIAKNKLSPRSEDRMGMQVEIDTLTGKVV